ncbi:MAG TPA: hypothetical protein VKB88_36500 [Bryobacteraceae bacterium]|nr:hypothetical protein [Bryobacteraceae bacterium]
MTLQQLIEAAYHVTAGTLFGTPRVGWASESFDLDAEATGNSTFDEDLGMLPLVTHPPIPTEVLPPNAPAQDTSAWS